MAYVDLTLIRAKLVHTPETSNHTSVKQCIENIKTKQTNEEHPATKLYPFMGNPRKNMPEGLRFNLKDYIELAITYTKL